MVLFIVLAVIAAGLALPYLFERRHTGLRARTSEHQVDADEQARIERYNRGAGNNMGPGGF